MLKPVFAAPLYSTSMPGAEALNAELRALFLAKEQGGAANKDPYLVKSKGLFESSFDLFDWTEPPVVKLRNFCLAHLYKLIGELNGYDRATLGRLNMAHESWFHITRKGGYFGIHNHPMHSWSGVYTVCQESDEGVADSGLLTFVNPNATKTMFLDMATFRMGSPYSSNNLPMQMKAGDLVLFPSWLLHEVTPFQPVDEDGLRITVAFNARFALEGDLPQ